MEKAQKALYKAQAMQGQTDVERFSQITSQKTRYPDSDPLAAQIASFVDSIRSGSEPMVTGGDGRRALKVALGIIDQITRGCKNFQSIC